MTPVRGRVENHIVRPALDAAIQRGFQRFVAAVALIEGQIVGIDDEPPVDLRQIAHQEWQVIDVLTMDFDKRAIHTAVGDVAVNSLYKR